MREAAIEPIKFVTVRSGGEESCEKIVNGMSCRGDRRSAIKKVQHDRTALRTSEMKYFEDAMRLIEPPAGGRRWMASLSTDSLTLFRSCTAGKGLRSEGIPLNT